MNKIRQLEKRCDREIQAACEKYTVPKLNDVTIEIWSRYASLIERAKNERPLTKYGKFLENLAIQAIKHEADNREVAHDISYEELYVLAGQGGIEWGQNNGRGAL